MLNYETYNEIPGNTVSSANTDLAFTENIYSLFAIFIVSTLKRQKV